MPRTRIKICSVCRPQDAAAAASAGADAIGIVFHSSSPRYVSIDLARQIVAAVPPFVAAVGLFVDADADSIRRVLDQVPLAAIQLQGSESPQYIAQLNPIPVIKAIHVGRDQPGSWRSAIDTLSLTNLRGFVLDTASNVPGGSGIPNDWSAIERLKKSGDFDGLPQIIVAGGLTPQNVGSVVTRLRPYAVDVSSGVESALREKSVDKIKAFVEAVRSAE